MESFPKKVHRQFWIAFAVLAGLAELPLAANPIHLQCVVTDSYLVSDYGGELTNVQRELCVNLKLRLDGKALLLAWDYVPFDGDGEAPKPALMLKVFNEGQTRKLALQLERKNYPLEPWTGIWKEPGDTLPDPLAGNAPEFFAKKTEELILSRIEERIQKNLMGIAITSASWSPAGAPKVITSLPWKGNEALRASRFRLACLLENQRVVEFESHALLPDDGPLSLEAQYRLPDGKNVSEILPQVKRLKPKWLFLLEFRIPDDTEIYVK